MNNDLVPCLETISSSSQENEYDLVASLGCSFRWKRHRCEEVVLQQQTQSNRFLQ